MAARLVVLLTFCVTGAASISPREHYLKVVENSKNILPPASAWRTPGPWDGNNAKPASFSAGFSDYGYVCVLKYIHIYEASITNEWIDKRTNE